MKKNILFFFIGVMVTAILGLVIITIGKEGAIINNKASFEDKEKCMKYYDSYKRTLEERRNTEENSKETIGYMEQLGSYEMFYSPVLDTCVSAYYFYGFTYDTDDNMHPYPMHRYAVVDYLNGEKELYGCIYDTFLIHLQGGSYIDDYSCSMANWEKAKDKYKS